MSKRKKRVPESIRGLNRQQKVLLFVYGILGELKKKGAVEGGRYRLAPGGMELYECLKKSGFRPTQEEINDVMAFVVNGEGDDE